MSYDFARNNISRRFFIAISRKRIEQKVKDICPLISKSESVIDIGSGNCLVSNRLSEEGYNIQAYDIEDHSFFTDFSPKIFDGKRIPIRNDFFDVALLITVLHHTTDPESILKEASRVAKKIIILEEVYENAFDKYITFFIDSLFNMELSGNPHSNLKDSDWKRIFKKNNLKILDVLKYRSTLGLLKRIQYVVEK